MINKRIALLIQLVFFVIVIGLISCDKEEKIIDDPIIFIEADELNVGELEIYKTLYTSGYSLSELEIQTDADWISYELNYNLMHFSFLPNQTNSSRSAKITFIDEGKVIDELTVNQEVFAIKYPEGALTLDDISYSANCTIDNMPVTSDCLVIYGFSESYNLEAPGAKEIIIPPYYFVEGKLRMVGVINHNAFDQKNLTKVILPEYLYFVESEAFNGNQLSEIDLKNIIYIDGSAFANNKLVEVNIPNTVRYIGYESFSNNLLEKVTIGSGVTTIDEKAFQMNDKLCDVVNNSSLVLTQAMFPKCPIGQCGIVSNYVFAFKSDLSYDETHVVNYVGTSTEALIPNSVTKIGKTAFYNKSLTAITLPPYLTNIEPAAFGSNKIKAVSFNENIEFIGSGAFNNNEIQQVSFENCSKLKMIDSYAFATNMIKSVSFNANIEVIGNRAFAYNTIQQVSFENNSKLKKIDYNAFYSCSASSIVLPTNINPGFHHYEDSDGNVVTEITEYYGKIYYACKEDGTRIE